MALMSLIREVWPDQAARDGLSEARKPLIPLILVLFPDYKPLKKRSTACQIQGINGGPKARLKVSGGPNGQIKGPNGLIMGQMA